MKTTPNNHVIGTDGCKGGWLTVRMTSLKTAQITLLEKISDIKSFINPSTPVWIDMPIGLSEGNNHRDLEAHARPYLKPYKSSSIFTPPCREAVYQTDYQSAKQANLKQSGKSISIQSWNISDKIRELDTWLLSEKGIHSQFFEAHPEICFAALNQMQPLQESKHTPEGLKKRLSLLSVHFPSSKTLFEQALKDFPRKLVKPDDILDAVCLALCAYLSQHAGIKMIEGSLKQDSRGLFIRMVYPIIP